MPKFSNISFALLTIIYFDRFMWFYKNKSKLKSLVIKLCVLFFESHSYFAENKYLKYVLQELKEIKIFY
jgi:hypothetical protein